jgi:hypothetical protein
VLEQQCSAQRGIHTWRGSMDQHKLRDGVGCASGRAGAAAIGQQGSLWRVVCYSRWCVLWMVQQMDGAELGVACDGGLKVAV